MFLQPDWFEVTEAGVGTNRYAYAGGDPVNVGGPGGNSATPSATQPVTVTFAEVEIRNYRQGNAEVVLTYPHPNIRIAYTRTTAGVLAFSIEYLFTDQLGIALAVVADIYLRQRSR